MSSPNPGAPKGSKVHDPKVFEYHNPAGSWGALKAVTKDSCQERSALVLWPPSEKGVSSALLARGLGIEHALIRRACTTLEEADWVHARLAGGASSALRVMLIKPLPAMG
ncbi:MAG: hypothetical protein ACTH5D_00810 [Halomonas sp.]|uniref:hypothetical protein n=1 Tax=Halomonas sp. TaxID=1486246 RepID=UPI003F90F781